MENVVEENDSKTKDVGLEIIGDAISNLNEVRF